MDALSPALAYTRPSGAATPHLNHLPDHIREAAQDFESVFLTSMLQPMFDTLGDEAFGGGAGASTWRSLLVEEYAQSISRAGGVGIADAVGRELLALQEQSRSAPSDE